MRRGARPAPPRRWWSVARAAAAPALPPPTRARRPGWQTPAPSRRRGDRERTRRWRSREGWLAFGAGALADDLAKVGHALVDDVGVLTLKRLAHEGDDG